MFKVVILIGICIVFCELLIRIGILVLWVIVVVLIMVLVIFDICVIVISWVFGLMVVSSFLGGRLLFGLGLIYFKMMF